jgi:hypothetical protein
MRRDRPEVVSAFFSRLVKDREGEPVEVDYRVEASFTPGVPAKTYGPPEKCYPEEPAQIEYTRALELAGENEKAVDLAAFIESLSQAEEELLQEKLALVGMEQEDEWEERP